LLMQQQQGVHAAAAQASAAGAAAARDGARHQQQPSGIRALPAGIGPWPKPLSASAADADSSSLSASHEAGAQQDLQAAGVVQGVGSPFAAAAATAAAFDKVWLLRCLLVYHLQASLLYDAEVIKACGDSACSGASSGNVCCSGQQVCPHLATNKGYCS
jgi:hypothetical protein